MPAKGEGTRTAGRATSLVTDMQGRYLVGLNQLMPVEKYTWPGKRPC